MKIQQSISRLKSDMIKTLDDLLNISLLINEKIDNKNKRAGYCSKIPIVIFNNNILKSKLAGYPIIQCLKYFYDNTNRQGKCNFSICNIIEKCGYKVNSNKGKSVDKFNNMIDLLVEYNVISRDYKSIKPKINDLMIIELNDKIPTIELFEDDYNLLFNHYKDNSISITKSLYIYAFLTYCDKLSINPTLQYIFDSLSISRSTAIPNLKLYKELGLDKYIPLTYSNPESIINNLLTENNIKFENEKRFKDDNVKYKPFDFYIKDLNLIIEYDGEHHFQPVRFGGMSEEKAIENFIKTKENDEIKNQYCKDNGIDLLRIPYTEKDNIESIIINKLNSIKSIN